MTHPRIVNLTRFVFEPLFLADEELRPLFVPVVKATFDIAPEGALALAPEQLPLLPAGERWEGSEEASFRIEPEGAFFKPATDVALVGHAHARTRGTRELLVSFQLGTVRKDVRVLGERTWYRSLGSIAPTPPLPFERIPLRYERAFGGWDRSHPDPARHQFEPRNPLGVGFRASGSPFEEGLRLPNLEQPQQPLRAWGQRPTPAGFGFIAPEWQPRAALAGTHDAAWERTRKPKLPRDFDRRFLNAAAPGLVAPGYLKGDEQVRVVNASAAGDLAFALPGAPAPRVVALRSKRLDDAEVALQLDTVVVDTDVMKLVLLWRGNFLLSREPTELRELRVTTEDVRYSLPEPEED
jgi:hypothetical protein